MGSKKHKKESKKKKHRSRSRSPLDSEERERKRHKKHKDRKKDRSPDVEEVPVDSHLELDDVSPSRSDSVERDRRMRDERHRERDRDDSRKRSEEQERSRERSPPPTASSNQESLSVEETNRLRAKLGLKPLEVADKQPDEDGKLKDDLGEFYHRPAANIAAQQKAEKLRERLQLRKDKRKLETKLQTTLLADGSDDEDASAWVNKSRDIAKQKAEAAKRAAMLDEMDAVFGVSALVAEDERADRSASYTHRQLRGLRVAHDLHALGEERDVVLTLADKGVLAEDAEDVLVNVNMVDNEKYLKNIAERKKARAGYQAYDDEAAIEAEAAGLPKSVLAKYDSEIDTAAAERAKGFVIGDEAALEAKRFKQMMRSRMTVEKRLESLQMPAPRLAADYLDERELSAKFKKVKRKGKSRKRAKEEPIDVDDYDPNLVPLQTDDTDVKPELEGSSQLDEEEVEPDSELQTALARARRLRQTQSAATRVPKVEDILQRVKEEEPEVEAGDSATIVLDATAEFCRTLGDIPTYGQAGNRDRRAEIMELEEAEAMEAEAEDEAEAAGAWSRVDLHNEKPPDIAAGSSVALDAEPALGAGVAGALQVALSKGYLERAEAAPAPRGSTSRGLLAAHYSIEDKVYGEDDKHGRRERGYSGPLSDFREKSHFKPNIKLEYVDDDGRPLCPKEAFRYLSHKFHGKGPGKNKQEKRIKKAVQEGPNIKLEYVDDDGRPLCPKEAFRYLSHKFHGKGPGKNKQEKRIKKAVQEGLMKKMSSTDTPLNTLALLQEKQKETHSPFIVLSGTKKDQPN